MVEHQFPEPKSASIRGSTLPHPLPLRSSNAQRFLLRVCDKIKKTPAAFLGEPKIPPFLLRIFNHSAQHTRKGWRTHMRHHRAPARERTSAATSARTLPPAPSHPPTKSNRANPHAAFLQRRTC